MDGGAWRTSVCRVEPSWATEQQQEQLGRFHMQWGSWACAREPVSRNRRSTRAWSLAPPREKPCTRGPYAAAVRAPCSPQPEKARTQQRRLRAATERRDEEILISCCGWTLERFHKEDNEVKSEKWVGVHRWEKGRFRWGKRVYKSMMVIESMVFSDKDEGLRVTRALFLRVTVHMPCEYVTTFQVLRKLFHSSILMYTLCCVKMSVWFSSSVVTPILVSYFTNERHSSYSSWFLLW